ncbi:MAG TPA: hypothetical protein VLT82_09360 [Myxococcaceae bacterium]|nr:hypothetical protein [Myxococcaceae bacterium]
MRLSCRLAPRCVLLFGICELVACAEPAAPASAAASATEARRASPQVVEAVRSATTRAPGKTESVAVPEGGHLQRVTLGSGYQHVVVGRLEADGTVSTACVDSAPQAEAFLSGSASGGAGK